MKKFRAFLKKMLPVTVLIIALCAGPASAAEKEKAAGTGEYNFELEEILSRMETRYQGTSFSADFFQVSTLKAIDVEDTARGRAQFKRPSKMKWEYTEPMKQLFISNGTTLWVYSPEENQVMIGGHPEELDFLSNMSVIRERYEISFAGKNKAGNPVLNLSPRKKREGAGDIRITVSGKSHEILEIATTNINDDETRITFSNFKFDLKLADDLFNFQVPEGTDVIR